MYWLWGMRCNLSGVFRNGWGYIKAQESGVQLQKLRPQRGGRGLPGWGDYCYKIVDD